MLDILGEAIEAVRLDARAGTLSKARVLARLSTVALRAFEVAELEDRLATVERQLADERRRGRLHAV